MDENIRIFNHAEFGSVRTVADGGEVRFCAKDIAAALGYSNTVDAVGRHCRGVAKRYPILDSLGRTQDATFISEPDVFRLIVSSKLPTAQRFEAWVFEEVLPSIHRTGGYMVAEKDCSCAVVNKDIYLTTIEGGCAPWCFQQRSDTTRRTSFAIHWPSTGAPILNSSTRWRRRKAGISTSKTLYAPTSIKGRGRSSSRSPRSVTPCFTWRLASATDMKGSFSC